MAPRYPTLNPDKALIWRIIHQDNLNWIFANGLHCASSVVQDPDFLPIGDSDLIAGRKQKDVPLAPFGTLSDYVPFYFTPFSPMMMNIFSGRGVTQRARREICILVSTLSRMDQMKIDFLFTDRHAYTDLASFYSQLKDLDKIDWERIQDRDFKRDPEDPEKFEKYQAEALIHQHVPADALVGVICYSNDIQAQIAEMADNHGLEIDVRARPEWYL